MVEKAEYITCIKKTKVIPVWLKKETERRQQELLEIGPLWWEILKRILAL